MRCDVKSNVSIVESVAAASYTAGAENGTAYDHSAASSVSFFISVGTVGASATVDMKTQYSDNNSDWTDYGAADEAGNDNAITQITAAGTAVLHVPNPRGRYSRVVVTVATAACVLSVTGVASPLRHIAPA